MGASFFIFSLFINIGFLSCIELSFSVVTLFPFKFSLSNFLQSGGRGGDGAPGGQYRGRRRSCMTLPFLVHTHPSTYLADSLNNNNNNNNSYFYYSHISWFVNLYSVKCVGEATLLLNTNELFHIVMSNENNNNNPDMYWGVVLESVKFVFLKHL